MSEPVIKQRPTVDLDDFERRMRQPAAYGHDDDPLAELARLVGEQPDPFGDVFSHGAAADPHQDAYHQGYAPHGQDAAEAPSRPFGDFAAIEAGLRGSLPSHPEYAGHEGSYQQNGGAYQQNDAAYADQTAAYGQDAFGHDWADRHAHQAPPRSRRPIYIMAATIAVGVIGIGTAFALKGRISSSPSDIKTIMADAGPTKVQPPLAAAADQGSQDPTAFGKGNQAAPTQLVNREEQPVDIAQSVQDRALADEMRKSSAATSVTDASVVPVPLSPGQARTAMADPNGRDTVADQPQGFGLSDMPAPKRVKVVSVRPDGTILPNDQPPAAAMPAPRQVAPKAPDRATPVAKASTPKVPTAKSTTRATATPKSIDSIASADDETAPKPVKDTAPKPVKKAKPMRLASADPGEQEATEAVSPTPAAGGNGGFAVQLAAPGSEAEAKAASSRFTKKFAETLGSYRLGFHKAESNGKSVYRVRVSSLSRADATSLCDKLKADGGTCFVAKN